MVFSSISFLFFFLPIVIAVYFAVTPRLKNGVLLFASLIFYAWGEPFYVLLMVVSIVTNYYLGILMDEYDGEEKKRKIAFILAVVFNLSLLGLFKYANFLIDNINRTLPFFDVPRIHALNIVLPIGISFYTFQILSYIIDLYRREIPVNKNMADLGLYITLFPQLIAGPIVRYQDIQAEINVRSVDMGKFSEGCERFIVGLSKKVILANPLGAFADSVFALPSEALTFPLAWTGVACYTLQIYFDFSGYSCMAIGLGKMFGFTFLENFNYPYIADSIKDFWRRWHISLSTWFKDYLYIPLGGNRHGAVKESRNKIIVFLLCGLWHGASWSFVVWGAYHGMLQFAEGIPFIISMKKRLPVHVNRALTMVLVMIGWVFFRSATLSQAKDFLATMFLFSNRGAQSYIAVPASVVVFLAIGSIAAVPWRKVLPRFHRMRGSAAMAFCLLALLCVDALLLASSTYNPFIYFRF